jgi:hypothetical protein
MKVRFLIDENLPPALRDGLVRLDEQIDELRVGEEGAPLLGTLDPDILRFCDDHRRLLITLNRISMPQHVADHLVAGGTFWGLCWVEKVWSFGDVLATLHLIWEASEAEEWINHTETIPY